jgi:hypothetical protein
MIILCCLFSCKKFVEVNELKEQLLAKNVFENSSTANAATAGIYRSTRDNLIIPITLHNSLISDDITPYTGAPTNSYVTNKLETTNTGISWSYYYSTIYLCNSVIEGLTENNKLSGKARDYYLSEAKFNRALMYFYLVNIYGDSPLILTTDVTINNTMPRTPMALVYTQMVKDLTEASAVLGADYSFTGGEKVRANKWVAKALLARVYLYLKDYINAEKEANDVITSGVYSLLNTPTGIFTKNNTEAILQWGNMPTEANSIASNFIYASTPSNICTTFLLNAFEPGDLRKTTWIKTQTYLNQPVSFPFKFTSTAAGSNEYYTIMRLAEQYLIRAECKAMRNDFQGCIDDINLIRLKHGNLTIPLSAPTNQKIAMDVILRERQVDLFTEGMHRWFDLKRTGRLETVMLSEKPTTWKSYAVLYPIPFTDIQRNPNLKQNPGYE